MKTDTNTDEDEVDEDKSLRNWSLVRNFVSREIILVEYRVDRRVTASSLSDARALHWGSKRKLVSGVEAPEARIGHGPEHLGLDRPAWFAVVVLDLIATVRASALEEIVNTHVCDVLSICECFSVNVYVIRTFVFSSLFRTSY